MQTNQTNMRFFEQELPAQQFCGLIGRARRCVVARECQQTSFLMVPFVNLRHTLVTN
jgi:hypothetical protein